MVALDISHREDKSGSALRAALEREVEGEVRFDTQARALYATDASNYREVPVGVVIPKSLEDVERAVAVCRSQGAAITSRGGGTSLAGQCCNAAVVIDFSKYLNRILEIDPEHRSAWVEPGCVLDDLRQAAGEHGLTFGPDPATHDHCTLGGMTGNNSCGTHSVMAGRTADNIEALEILTYDGERMVVGETDEVEFASMLGGGGRKAEIFSALRRLVAENANRIRAVYPDIPRRVSGFNLDELLPERGFNVARALVGSEGTCVTILRVKCRLVPDPSARVLMAIGFPDVFAAADAAPSIRAAGAIGLEGIDEEFVRYMRVKHVREEDLSLLPEGDSWLLAEFGGETREEAERKATALEEDLGRRGNPPSTSILTDPEDQEALWKVREAGLPATAHVPGMRETHPGWEDAAVPPERLGDYLRDFRKLLEAFGYKCALYGHFGDGCIHCRIDFDLESRDGIATYRRFIDRAADLVVSYGGSLSGEHGDGEARGALLDKMFGSDLTGAFREFKEIWDPQWKMNPGKVVAAPDPTANLRREPDHAPWQGVTRFTLTEDGEDFAAAAARCVGVGKCRKHDSGVMCPSYMATGEEAYSTRGRARLLYEMVHGDVVEEGWRSGAVHEALDLCLACKACKDECPVQVDMATYKAEFMHHYYRGRLRPREAYTMGLIWWWARLGSHVPRLANGVARAKGIGSLVKWMGGFAQEREVPAFAPQSFRSWFGKRTRSGKGERGRVLLWPDTFNGYFTTGPLKAAVAVLEDAGFEVDIPKKPLCCGRPLYAFGFLDRAEKLWDRTLDELGPEIEEGIPVIGVEPTCVAAFRDELPQMKPRDERALSLARNVMPLGEFLAKHDYTPRRGLSGDIVLHPHCHHRAILDVAPDAELLRRTGLEVSIADDGCCGMAGDYGFRRATYDVSMKLGERAFLPEIREHGHRHVVADGFSCREQAAQSLGVRPATLAEMLAACLQER